MVYAHPVLRIGKSLTPHVNLVRAVRESLVRASSVVHALEGTSGVGDVEAHALWSGVEHPLLRPFVAAARCKHHKVAVRKCCGNERMNK